MWPSRKNKTNSRIRQKCKFYLRHAEGKDNSLQLVKSSGKKHLNVIFKVGIISTRKMAAPLPIKINKMYKDMKVCDKHKTC